MNRENMQKLIDFLEKLPSKKFDMRHFLWNKKADKLSDEFPDDWSVTSLDNCGTTGCIAAWTCLVAGEKEINSQIAGDWLGLDEPLRLGLFYGEWIECTEANRNRAWATATPKQAAKHLRKLMQQSNV